MMYLGVTCADCMARPRNVRISIAVGCFLKTAKLIALREKWSITIRTHQQNGQPCGSVNGNQVVQNPPFVGTTVMSTCQTWFGYLAVTIRPDLVFCTSGFELALVSVVVLFAASIKEGLGPFGFGSLIILPTVETLKCKPARLSISAILTFPKLGHSVFKRETEYRRKSGNLFTGSEIFTKASGPSSSTRLSQLAIVAGATKNCLAVSRNDPFCAAFICKISKRSSPV